MSKKIPRLYLSNSNTFEESTIVIYRSPKSLNQSGAEPLGEGYSVGLDVKRHGIVAFKHYASVATFIAGFLNSTSMTQVAAHFAVLHGGFTKVEMMRRIKDGMCPQPPPGLTERTTRTPFDPDKEAQTLNDQLKRFSKKGNKEPEPVEVGGEGGDSGVG